MTAHSSNPNNASTPDPDWWEELAHTREAAQFAASCCDHPADRIWVNDVAEAGPDLLAGLHDAKRKLIYLREQAQAQGPGSHKVFRDSSEAYTYVTNAAHREEDRMANNQPSKARCHKL